MSIAISERQLFELLVCSLRYAIGRSTYVTTEVADAIRQYFWVIPSKDRDVLIKDVTCAVTEGVADSDTVWGPLLLWMEAQRS